MKYTQDYWDDVRAVVGAIPGVEQLHGKRILITGATGMVCSPVVEILSLLNRERQAGIHVILAGRSVEKLQQRFGGLFAEGDIEYLPYDATQPCALDVRADYIIHGASNANPAMYVKEPVETLVGSVVGLDSVLKAAAANEGSRLLYISSSEVYGRKEALDEPYTEDMYGYVDILNPRACYPDGKRAAETLCACYSQEYGVDTVIVRLGHIYGPSITESDSRASASFTRDVIARRDIVMKSPGAQLRSYCYTLDCASAILAVLLNGERGEAYNISNAASVVTIRDIAEALAKAGDVDIVFEIPTDTEKSGYNLMDNSSLDSKKIESLGWKALFSLEEGTKRTIELLSGK